MNERAVTQVALALGRLLGEDVALARLEALEVTLRSAPKALFCARVAFHLGHTPMPPNERVALLDSANENKKKYAAGLVG
jgi:hypothetical protein